MARLRGHDSVGDRGDDNCDVSSDVNNWKCIGHGDDGGGDSVSEGEGEEDSDE